jgi:hypothetical protein
MSNLNLHSMSKTQLVTHALFLGLIAPTEEKSQACASIADCFAGGLSDEQLEGCKAMALQLAEGNMLRA